MNVLEKIFEVDTNSNAMQLLDTSITSLMQTG